MIERPRGTRDLFPEEMEIRNTVEGILRNVVESYGYREIMTPTFEHTDLFLKKSGPSIIEEIYAFKDKGDRDIALRPEFTASVMRMYHEGMREVPKPIKLYYIGSVFRYERPQSGRYREFWHFGTELIGPNTPQADAENISLAYDCVSKTGLKGFEMRISNLMILSTYLEEQGVPEGEKDEIFHLIDKEEEEELMKYPFGDDLISFMDSDLEDFKEYLKDTSPVDYLTSVLDGLKYYGIDEDDYSIDLSTVRGLDYYQGVVFEIDAPNLGAEKQICGGGDYKLGSIFGTDVTAKGFAFGFDRLVLALGEENISPVSDGPRCYMIPIGEEAKGYAFEVLSMLRDDSITVDLELMDRTIGKALSYADKMGFDIAFLVGENEVKDGIVTVKNMKTGEQTQVSKEDLVKYLCEYDKI